MPGTISPRPACAGALLALLMALALLVGVAGEAVAERRVALVIGNAAYRHAGTLANPGNDAAAVARTLGQIGFEVHDGRDLDKRNMERLLREFARHAAGAELALVYFAGHGLQVDGRNWLLPVDARLEDVVDLEFEALALDAVMRVMERAGARVVMLDACRDNPFVSSMRTTGATRQVALGLARAEPVDRGTLLVFATSPGAVAADGAGRHSPFTAALLEHLPTPGIEVRQMLTRVRQSVVTATGGGQTPWENSSLLSDVYLAAAPAAAAPARAVPSRGEFDARALDLAFWEAIADSDRAEDFAEYLRRFPDGVFAGLAESRMAALRQPEAAPPPAAAPPAERRAAPAAPPADTRDAVREESLLFLERDDILRIQVALHSLGFGDGTVDGVLGMRTREAIQEYQQAENAAPTGYLTRAQVRALIGL